MCYFSLGDHHDSLDHQWREAVTCPHCGEDVTYHLRLEANWIMVLLATVGWGLLLLFLMVRMADTGERHRLQARDKALRAWEASYGTLWVMKQTVLGDIQREQSRLNSVRDEVQNAKEARRAYE